MSASLRKKTSKACDECRSKKVKCDGLTVCTRCAERGLQCSYTYVFKKRSRTVPSNNQEYTKRKRGRPKKDDGLNSEHPLNPHLKSDLNVDYSNSSDATNTEHDNDTESLKPNGNFGDACCEGQNSRTRSSIKPEIQLPISITSLTPYADSFPRYSPQLYPGTSSIPITTQPPNPLQQQQNFQGRSQKHEISKSIVTSPTIDNNGNNVNANIEERLSKMESMISLLVSKISPSHTSPYSSTLLQNSNSINTTHSAPPINATNSITENPLLEDSSEQFSNIGSNSLLEEREQFEYNGLFMHTSIFFLSKVGLMVLEQKMEKPEYITPLRKIIEFTTPHEPGILSLWINTINETELNPLPSRENINTLILHLETSFFLAKAINFKHLKRLFKLYCDRRDGLINEPKFRYDDYFFMNSTLLVSCSFINEHLFNDLADISLPLPDFEGVSLKEIENELLRNSLFYYHKCSVISGGLSSISGCLLLAFYADYVLLSRASYLISSTAIRQAQELGLHIEETYRGLQEDERSLRLSIWWACYIFDKEMCVRWAQAPVINDKDVSAPPLPGFETFWSPNNSNLKDQKSNRSLYLHEIQVSLDPYLETVSKFYTLDQYLTTDYAFITSKIYDTFLRANALKDLKREEVTKLKDEIYEELECWRLTIPEEVRPTPGYDEVFFNYIGKLNLEKILLSTHKVLLATTFYVRYHHVKLMVDRAYKKYCFLEYSESITDEQLIEPTVSARCIIRISCLIDPRFGNYSNFFIFYPFNAFLSLCGYYIHVKKMDENIQSDLQLLLDCLKLHVKPFSLLNRSDNRTQCVDFFLKGILYATYKTCINRFGEDAIKLKNLEILNDIDDLNNGKITVGELMKFTVDFSSDDDIPFSKLPYYSNRVPDGVANPTMIANPVPTSSPSRDGNFYPSMNPRLNSIPNLGNPDSDRTPNVSFLLSPSSQMPDVNRSNNVSTGHNSETNLKDVDQWDNHWHREGIFQNMLNIPNYFLDYISDDHLNLQNM